MSLQLNNLSRKELQSLAKDKGLKANLSNDILKSLLLEEVKKESKSNNKKKRKEKELKVKEIKAPEKKKAKGEAKSDENDGKEEIAAKCIFDEIIDELKKDRARKLDNQINEAKEFGWSFDPRPKVSEFVSFYDVIVKMDALNVVIDNMISKYTSNKDVKALGSLFEKDLSTVATDFSFDTNQLSILGLNMLFLQIDAEKVIFDYSKASNKEELVALLCTINVPSLIKSFPFEPAFFQFKRVRHINHDPKDEERSWCEKFEHHLLWLFQELEANKAYTYGRIKIALGEKPTVKCDVNEDYISFIASRFGGSALCLHEEENEHKSVNSVALAKYSILASKFDIRTYISVFAFNVRESDYDGEIGGIAEYAADQSEEFCNWGEFIQLHTLNKTDEVKDFNNLMTSAFYIPGQKVEWENNNEENNLEEDVIGEIYNGSSGEEVDDRKKEEKVLLLGCDNSGKTSLLYRLHLGKKVHTIPTIGFNVENVRLDEDFNVECWDVGGQQKIRPLWRHYYSEIQGIVFTIDGSDIGRLEEAKIELKNLFSTEELKNKRYLIVVTKINESEYDSVIKEMEKDLEIEAEKKDLKIVGFTTEDLASSQHLVNIVQGFTWLLNKN